MAYRIEFDRIGRNRSVPPLHTSSGDATQIAEAIHKYARKHLRSRDYDVDVDLEKMRGFIACGMHNGGEFRITAV